MKFLLVTLALVTAVPAFAQQQRNAAMVRLLGDGYEIKAAFVDASIPYVFLQKGQSAYLCKGGTAPTCEKLS